MNDDLDHILYFFDNWDKLKQRIFKICDNIPKYGYLLEDQIGIGFQYSCSSLKDLKICDHLILNFDPDDLPNHEEISEISPFGFCVTINNRRSYFIIEEWIEIDGSFQNIPLKNFYDFFGEDLRPENRHLLREVDKVERVLRYGKHIDLFGIENIKELNQVFTKEVIDIFCDRVDSI